MVLISVVVAGLDRDAIVVNLEAIVGPERVIESERTFLVGCRVNNNRLRAILKRES